MPKKKTVDSLERLCLEYVADTMEDIWARAYTDSYLDDGRSPDALGPFIVLPDLLLQELFQLVKNKEPLTSAVLRLFLVPQLKKLDLSSCTHQVSESFAQTIAARCKKLSTLDLYRCNEVPAETLIHLVKELPSIVKLGLSETQCNTQVLVAIRSCCSQLRDLDISGCANLSLDSVLHLVYDPAGGSLCCQSLQVLEAGPSSLAVNMEDCVWILVFVLLALPKLELLFHFFVAEAVCLIHSQQFGSSQILPGFPSLEKLAWWRRTLDLPREESARLTLRLREVQHIEEPSLPLVCAVCPHLEEVSVILRGRPGWSQSFSSCGSISRLSLYARECEDLRALLPVLESLGPQLRSLYISGFCFIDRFSFHVLLRHCVNLQKLSIYFCSPLVYSHGEGQPDFAALDWDFRLPPLQFPWLHEFSLTYADTENPLPFPHVLLLEHSLQWLLTHSPYLDSLNLSHLPFDLDQLFYNVLVPPSTALLHLSRVTLEEVYASLTSVHLLLISQNELSYLKLLLCSEIHQMEYERILDRVDAEGFDLEVEWG
nr:uncharacterized protein LOC110091245 isoform X1 [Pogona vitticeps]XP_020670946.1 uncharacterized protein LOC110091245 isoform X1 [Pogona vitticeps]